VITVVSSFYNEQDGIESYFKVVNQLIKENPRISFILVNNGSTDNTLHLLKTHASNDPRIEVLNNPEGIGYADGIRAEIFRASTEYVLIYPGDMQFSIDGINKVLFAFDESLDSRMIHNNILTYRRRRHDGRKNSIRGFIWKHLVILILGLNFNIDPASQLRILCKCCILESTTSNFIWDIEIIYNLNKNLRISRVVDVEFFPREYGISSLKMNLFKTEVSAVFSLFKIRFRNSKI
jgi:GT2 family glycosyltransferase